ncbi:hypothetical protein BGW41_008278 [Actinomortierella wolfii]|nr:hypothetical protein BGW41_008278 [Actinomortierella wolfii]
MQDSGHNSNSLTNGHTTIDHPSLPERQAMMQARRKSRGYGQVPMLNPNFVFPPLPANNSNGNINGHSSPALHSQQRHREENTSKTQPDSLVPPVPRGHEQLKTHFRTHSRNGSTVTVKDLKDAIAKASVDLLDELTPNAAQDSTASAVTDSPSTAAATVSAPIATALTDAPPVISLEQHSLGSTPVPSPASKQTPAESVSSSPSTFLDQVPKSPVQSSFVSTVSPVGSRPSSVVGSRSGRDRTAVSVPPFFAFSVPHEYPSPYTSPRLKLPGAVASIPLPMSPFARKRKPQLFHSSPLFPSSTLTIKLSASDAGSHVQHGLPVGSNNAEPDLWERIGTVGIENLQEDELEEMVEEQSVADRESHGSNEGSTAEPSAGRAAATNDVCGNQSNTQEQKHQRESAGLSQEAKEQEPSTLESVSISAADKRMSWASMVTMDELESKVAAAAPVSQPYRPPGARARLSANGAPSTLTSPSTERPGRSLPSSLSSEPGASTSAVSATSRTRKAAPPPLNLVNSNTSPSPTQANASTANSPTTPTTPSSRRRRSRSRKNAKDKEARTENEIKASKDERPSTSELGDEVTADAPEKKTRTRSRSRSRSRSRNRAKADKDKQAEDIPPVPQTPSWVPAHNMAVAGSTLTTVPPSPRTLAPSSSLTDNAASGSHSDSGESTSTGQEPSSPTAKTQPGTADSSTEVSGEPLRRGVRPARLTTTRLNHGTPLQTVSESGQAMFSPRSRDGSGDYFSMRPLQHPPRTPMTPMTPGGEFGEDDDDYYRRLPVTTPMIQQGFFPNWAKGDAQLEELQRIRNFLADRKYPDEMPLSDEWTLFFSDTSRAKDKNGVQDAYSSAITPLFSCHTVPQFATSWKYVRERVRPATMKVNQNLHWFKKGIKPIWEDPKNKYGGRLTICPPRALLDVVWETVLILMAGDVLDLNGEGTGAVFARRARGDRIEVWLGSDDTPEALAHIRGRLAHELASSGADELVRIAKYKKHFDSKKEEKAKQAAAKEAAAKEAAAAAAASGTSTPSSSTATHPAPTSVSSPSVSTNGSHHGMASPGLSSPVLNGGHREYQSFQAFAQEQAAKLREREREQHHQSLSSPLGQRPSDIERIMQLGKERLEKERAERERLREEKVRAMTAAAMAASEAKHQQQKLQQRH